MAADALSCKMHGVIAALMIREWKALETMSDFNIRTTGIEKGQRFGCLVVQPMIIKRILKAQKEDVEFRDWFTKVSDKDPQEWNIGSDSRFRCKN